jgi:hypothetical protein
MTAKPLNEGKCWAEPLGGCGGPITREHLATESLFQSKVRVKGGFYGAEGSETSIRKLTANILCRDHNSELGRTADAAALRLYRHFQSSHKPMELHGSPVPRTPVDRRVSGVNFGRWLCKTHCNYMVAHGMTPDPAYTQYAFQQPTSKPIYIYLAAGVGEVMRLADGRDPVVGWKQLLADDPAYDGFSVSLSGFESVVSTRALDRNGKPMLDRVRVLEWPTELGPFRIVFDWSTDPPVQSITQLARLAIE